MARWYFHLCWRWWHLEWKSLSLDKAGLVGLTQQLLSLLLLLLVVLLLLMLLLLYIIVVVVVLLLVAREIFDSDLGRRELS